MSPAFADICDPIFMRVIALIDKIEAHQAIDRDFERSRLEALFREADIRVSDSAGWELAKYALAAWIDDLLINVEWVGQDWWENNSLEREFFKTRDRATAFYTKAAEAAELARRDALEAFYLCVVLGFRGLYSLEESAFVAEQLRLPSSLSAWADSTAQSLQLRQGRPRIQELPNPSSGAPPLEGKLLLVGVASVTTVLLAVVGALVYLTELNG